MKLKARDIYMYAMLAIGFGGIWAAAMGWIPSWLAATLLICALFAGIAGIIYFARKAGVPTRQIVIGLGISLIFAAALGVIGIAWSKFMFR